MPTLVMRTARTAPANALRGSRKGHRVLDWLWTTLAEAGQRRAHREVIRLLEARGRQATGDFDRDLQRYVDVAFGHLSRRPGR